ncbi:MAG: hypothetical protein JW751_30085 [Polyangiaceae bacterium]|nr:hypothetical protein [Polyangiaceae bacterium]
MVLPVADPEPLRATEMAGLRQTGKDDPLLPVFPDPPGFDLELDAVHRP